jgi:ubiquinol-cytochrome c reductase cytochrome b subunit
MRYRPVARYFFIFFFFVCIALGWCGAQSPATVLFPPRAEYRATLTWLEGAQSTSAPVAGASIAEMPKTMEQAERSAHGDMVMVHRTGATSAVLMTATGGTHNEHIVSANDISSLEEQITAFKAQVGPRAPFFSIRREIPFTFTVTMFAQLLTAYYFLFFLVILPVLGLRETPGRVPDTIAKSVHGAAAPQSAG